MNWKRADKYAERSDCGEYSICGIGFHGSNGSGARFFEAWRTRAHRDGPHLIATNLPTAAEARRLCAEDAADE